jgi:RNA recognition motif-containing protein
LSLVAFLFLAANLAAEGCTMTTRLNVGNLNATVTENDLYTIFNRTGLVMSIKVTDPARGQGNGSAVVDMSSPESAESAIKALNGYTLHERQITVSIA